jgi:FkbH-like protein
MHRDSTPQDQATQIPDFVSGRDLLDQARELARSGHVRAAARRLRAVAVAGQELPVWLAASRQIQTLPSTEWARRTVRLAVLGSHTTAHVVAALITASAAEGIALDIYEAPYGQYEQEILDASSGLAQFGPDVVLLAVDERALRFPSLSASPEEDLAAEVARWSGMWSVVRDRLGAAILQMTFVPALDDELGSLSSSVAGSRRRLVRRLNLALGDAAPEGVHLVDAEAVAMRAGAAAWSDPRYWFLSKHAIGLGALPSLARETAQVLSASLGLNRRVVVLDLDGTIWGGVVGEDGPHGIDVGDGPVGEAYQAFQEYLLRLRRRGMLLVAVSKNNESDARAPFVERPEMRLSLDDFAAFVPSWNDKPGVIERIAHELGLGLDTFVFVDDNPVEREAVRQALPDVGVVSLPRDPAHYIDALVTFPGMQAGALTAEDGRRTDQYRARLQVARLQESSGSREEFLAGLRMTLTVEPIGAANIKRVSQLSGKTNQFNLTGRRHSAAEALALAEQADVVAIAFRLRDAYDDHGLIGVLLARPDDEDLVVDTWLMSCRVLGRGLEVAVMSAVSGEARRRGHRRVVGEFVPTGRNAPARRAYPDAGFTPLGGQAADPNELGPERWVLDLAEEDPPSPYVTVEWA